MKLFVTRVALFSIFAIGVYIACLILWGTYAPGKLKPNLNYRLGTQGYTFSRLKEVKKIENVDILFTGSSHAYRGFDTRIFNNIGYSAFNLGTSAQTPMQTEVLLDRYLHQLNPRLVVYEVYPETFMFDGVESSLDLLANDGIDFSAVAMTATIGSTKVWNSLIFGLWRQTLNVDADFREAKCTPTDRYTDGGYVESFSTGYQTEAMKPRDIEFQPDNESAFESIIHRLKSEEISYILVYAPIPSTNYSRYISQSRFDEFMRSNGRYYNYNEIMTLADSVYFYDDDHLNQIGVDSFNRVFATQVRKLSF